MRVRWTPKARRTYTEIINYLETDWTEKEIKTFIAKVDHLLELIRHNPEMGEESRKKKNIRKILITKQNSLYYRVKSHKKELQLLVFWDNRKDPGNLEF